MLGVFTELETNLRRERQLEGIAAAKACGTYHGRTTAVSLSLMTENFTYQIAVIKIARSKWPTFMLNTD